MTKIRDYHLWEEDDYDPFAVSVNDLYSRGKRKKNAHSAKEKFYEEDEDRED